LEEVSTSPVTYIECYCISGHKAAHDFAEWSGSCSYE
jgi:hypothetical protein